MKFSLRRHTVETARSLGWQFLTILQTAYSYFSPSILPNGNCMGTE